MNEHFVANRKILIMQHICKQPGFADGEPTGHATKANGEVNLTHGINLSRYVDERPLSGFQIRVICLCALVVGLDGFDAQALGFVAPALSKDLHPPPGALGPVFGASLFGVMIDSLVFGALADYLGRKWLVVAGVLVFALGSL